MKISNFYKNALLSLCTIASPVLAIAQADIHFSQFYETSILRNPALTGVFSEDYKFSAVYRNQWSSITNPFETAQVSAETKIKVGHEHNDFFSFGALVYYDKAGSIDSRILGAYPAINYNKSLGDEHNSFLSVGFTGGYVQHSFDPSKATFNNQYQNNTFNAGNPTGENLPNPKLTLYDVGAGINFNSSSGEYNSITYVIGVSGYHFSQPNTSYYKDAAKINMDMRYNVNAALSGHFNESYSYQLQGNYALQGSYNEIIAGGLIGWNRISENDLDPAFAMYVGLFYRYMDAVIPSFKLKYKDLAFGLSYDVNVSTLSPASSYKGGYEISLIKTGHFRDKNATNGKPLCPNFY